MMLSVVIPSINEQYLQKTVDDVLAKATTKVEVIVVLDGYKPKSLTKARVIETNRQGMRASINTGMAAAKGKYVMKLDEHIMLAKSFDTKLIESYRKGWVAVPRRYRLDPARWEIIQDGRPPIDYMRLQVDEGYLHGVEWREQALKRAARMVDEVPAMQGSLWFMSKQTWEKNGPMDDKNYGQFANEAQEIGMKAWLSGGGIMVNKKTWYAHWHRNSGYDFTVEQKHQFEASVAKGRLFSYNYWTTTKDFPRDFNWFMANVNR